MSASLLFAIAAAGAVGALTRYALFVGLDSLWPSQPWPIAMVNILGCFGFGWCWAVGVGAGRWSPAFATALLVGFFGAFTTFSSFAFDVHRAWIEQRPFLLLANVLVQNLVGLMAMAVGIALGQAVARS